MLMLMKLLLSSFLMMWQVCLKLIPEVSVLSLLSQVPGEVSLCY